MFSPDRRSFPGGPPPHFRPGPAGVQVTVDRQRRDRFHPSAIVDKLILLFVRCRPATSPLTPPAMLRPHGEGVAEQVFRGRLQLAG
jgi:hypothetical protein